MPMRTWDTLLMAATSRAGTPVRPEPIIPAAAGPVARIPPGGRHAAHHLDVPLGRPARLRPPRRGSARRADGPAAGAARPHRHRPDARETRRPRPGEGAVERE